MATLHKLDTETTSLEVVLARAAAGGSVFHVVLSSVLFLLVKHNWHVESISTDKHPVASCVNSLLAAL
jgi:hypothetical protein